MSLALVAAIKHVPTEVAVKVAVAADVESAHPEAVPPVTTPYVTAPFPDPPVVAKLGPAVYALPE